MRYGFRDILNAEIYDKSRVVLITGKYHVFNNMVADTLKDMCGDKHMPNEEFTELSSEFGVEDTSESISNSVDFDTFMELADIPSINGKRFCRIELNTLNKKQKEALAAYLKQPSRYGVLVLMSDNFVDYKDYIKNRYFLNGQFTHVFSLNFPVRDVLKSIVQIMFDYKGIDIENGAIDYFILKMSTEYNEYETVINNIAENHKEKTLNVTDLKIYMKGIEYFDIDDFMYELVKPLASGKTGNKKIIRMLSFLKEKYDAEKLVIELLKRISELIDFRIMINTGIVPINIRYIFNDIVKLLGPDNKYAKMNEWVFRRKAVLASLTSLEDWVYMSIILNKALGAGFSGSIEVRNASERALYSLVTRTTFCEDRLNNVVGVDNILSRELVDIDRVLYQPELLEMEDI